MTDRELLKMAAKAVGGKLISESRFGDRYDIYSRQIFWDPLADDGDALRLAINLGICISFIPECDTVQAFQKRVTTGEPFNVHTGGFGDVETRLVIVQAAAEIGKTMP